MASFRRAKMPQHGKAGIDGMHEPEGRDFLRGKSGHAAPSAPRAGKSGALFVQGSNQPPGDHHQSFARGDLQAGRYEAWVVKKMSRAIPDDARDGKANHSLSGLSLKKESNVLASQVNGTVIPACIVVVQASHFGRKSEVILLGLRFHDAIRSVRLPRRHRKI